MRKSSILLLAVIGLLVVACSAYAVTTATATLQIYGKWNQIAAPIIPFDPDMTDNGTTSDTTGNPSLTGVPGCWNSWYGDWNTADRLTSPNHNDTLAWRDPISQSNVQLPDDLGSFPNILMGDGYLARCNTGNRGQIKHNLTYNGVDISDTQAWISLPGKTNGTGGWHYIGIPYPVGTACDFSSVVVVYTDPTTQQLTSALMGDLYAAGNQTVLSTTFFGWDSAGQNLVQCPDDGSNLYGGQMYKVFTKVSNIALILPLPQ